MTVEMAMVIMSILRTTSIWDSIIRIKSKDRAR